MVVITGWPQIVDTILVAVGSCGIACAMFGRFIENKGANILLRAALALACIVVMCHPNGNIAMVAAAFVLPATIIGVRHHRVIAQPKSELQPQSVR